MCGEDLYSPITKGTLGKTVKTDIKVNDLSIDMIYNKTL